MSSKSPPNYISPAKIKRLKQAAKILKKQSSLSHIEALEQVARIEGYSNWKAILRASRASNIDSVGTGNNLLEDD